MKASYMTELNDREQTLKILKELYEKGYRYVVRDKDTPYLSCFSLKPKRYREMEFWGYVDPYVDGAMMSYPIKNVDITEINYKVRKRGYVE